MNASASTSAAPEPQTAPHEGFFVNRDFVLLWTGETVSILGDFLFNTTLVVWIAAVIARGQAWAPLAVSGVFIAASTPAILVAPVAGALVDRMNKRAITMMGAALSAIVTLALAMTLANIGAPTGSLQIVTWTLGAIYITVALLAIVGQFTRPASLALIGMIVSAPARPRAMGFLQGSVSLAMLVGPAVAAPLTLALGAQWALLLNAASFVIAFATLASLRVRSNGSEKATAIETQGNLGQDLREGVAYLLQSRTLRVLTLVTGVAMLGAGALNALDVFFTTHNLHTPLNLYGLLNTALGLGLIAGAIIAGALAQRVGLARTLWLSTIALGALVIVYSRLGSFAAAATLLFFTGAPLAALDVVGGPLLLRETPERLIGRVSSLITPISTGATLAGAALAGYLDSGALRDFSARALGVAFGPVDTIYCAAGALILLSGVYAAFGLRGADARDQRPS